MATCDRLKSYWWIKRVPWCWAHLRRDFQAMIDRDNEGKQIGQALLEQSNTLFHLGHQVKEGKLSRAWFRVLHFSVQQDHVHLLVEANDKSALARGWQPRKPLIYLRVWRV